MTYQYLDKIIEACKENIYIQDVARSLQGIAQNPWAKWGALATIFLAAVALYTANKEDLDSLFKKPRVDVNERSYHARQGNESLIVSRLRIINSGGAIAKNATFIVEDLRYRRDLEWVGAENFVPFPLNWTHVNRDSQDLHMNRPYYLDLCRIEKEENEALRIGLCSPIGSPNLHGLNDLGPGGNEIKITLYCENSVERSYVIEINWDEAFSAPQVRIRDA